MSAAVATPGRAWTPGIAGGQLVPGWLRLMWGERRLGMSSACPACAPVAAHHRPEAVPLGLSVYHHSKAYRFHCAACGWRSPWFEARSDGRLVALMLDVP
jgi:hypothetical protein